MRHLWTILLYDTPVYGMLCLSALTLAGCRSGQTLTVDNPPFRLAPGSEQAIIIPLTTDPWVEVCFERWGAWDGDPLAWKYDCETVERLREMLKARRRAN